MWRRETSKPRAAALWGGACPAMRVVSRKQGQAILFAVGGVPKRFAAYSPALHSVRARARRVAIRSAAASAGVIFPLADVPRRGGLVYIDAASQPPEVSVAFARVVKQHANRLLEDESEPELSTDHHLVLSHTTDADEIPTGAEVLCEIGRFAISVCSRSPEPFDRRLPVLRNTYAELISPGQSVLPFLPILIGALPIPRGCRDPVFRDALTLLIHLAKILLPARIPVLRGPCVPFDRLTIVLR